MIMYLCVLYVHTDYDILLRFFIPPKNRSKTIFFFTENKTALKYPGHLDLIIQIFLIKRALGTG